MKTYARITCVIAVAIAAVAGCKKKPAGEAAGSGSGSAAAASGSAAGSGSSSADAVHTAEGGAIGTLPVVNDCPKSLTGSEVVARTIKKECGPIVVTGDYSNDGSLTLEAGVVLKVQDGVEIDIGYSKPAKIFVKGTLQEPVTLTSAGDPAPGAWKGLRLYGNANRSQIANLVVENAGSDKGAMYIDAADVSLKGTTIRNAKDIGLYVDHNGRFTEMSGNTFDKAGAIAMEIYAPAVGALGTNKFDDGAFVQLDGGSVEDNAKWQNPGAPYVVTGDIAIDGKNGRATLEIQAGTELRMKGVELDVGYSRDGRLIVSGTPDKPVVFTTAEDKAPGAWKQIGLYSKGDATITNATISYGGGADHGALYVEQGSGSVTGSTFEGNKRAVVVHGGGKLKSFDQNKLSAGPEPALTIVADQVAALGTGNTFAKDAHIEVTGGEIKGTAVTWNPQTVPYEITAEVSVDSKAQLTLPPGSDLAFDAGAQLSIGYGQEAMLKAVGTPDKPIKLHPIHDEQPWKGLFLYSNALNCEISNVVVGHTGGDAGIFVDHQAVAKISDVSCDGCANATLTSRCGAKLTTSNIKAGKGTPKGEIKPECN